MIASFDWPADGSSPPPPFGAVRALAERRGISHEQAIEVYAMRPRRGPAMMRAGMLGVGDRFAYCGQHYEAVEVTGAWLAGVRVSPGQTACVYGSERCRISAHRTVTLLPRHAP